jgi:hypothetical protein
MQWASSALHAGQVDLEHHPVQVHQETDLLLGRVPGVGRVPVVDRVARLLGADVELARAGDQPAEDLVVPRAVEHVARSAQRDQVRDEAVAQVGLARPAHAGHHDRMVSVRAVERVQVLDLAGWRDEQRKPLRAAAARPEQRGRVGRVLHPEAQRLVRHVDSERQRRAPEHVLLPRARHQHAAGGRPVDHLPGLVGGLLELVQAVSVRPRPGRPQQQVQRQLDQAGLRVVGHLLDQQLLLALLALGLGVAPAAADTPLVLALGLVPGAGHLVLHLRARQAVQEDGEREWQRLVQQLAQPEHARARRAAAEVAGTHQVLLDLAVVDRAAEVERAARHLLAQRSGRLLGLLVLDRRVEARQHPIPRRRLLEPPPGGGGRVAARDQIAQHLRAVEDPPVDVVSGEVVDEPAYPVHRPPHHAAVLAQAPLSHPPHRVELAETARPRAG